MQPSLNGNSGVTDIQDLQLVEGAKCGNHDAFGELIRRHKRRCVNLATSILRDRGEAEEEVQNACWKAYVHIDQFQGEAEFSTWLFRIVENQCLMLIRQKCRAQFVYLDANYPEHGTELPAREVDPEGELGSREVLQVLRTEIRRMPPLLREVLQKHDVEEMAISDLAAHLGITVAATKSRLLRARVELRQRMLRHCTRTGGWTLLAKVAAPPERVFHLHKQVTPSSRVA